uniref:Uncharacterized protein n=1 Tax=Oryza barthii TaxID=65489 RepID=A0A0D3GVW1_9ORYZ
MILRVASAGPGHRFQAVGQARRQDLGDGKLIYFSSLQLCLAIRNSLLGCGLQPYSEWVRAHPPFSTWICHSSSLREIGGVTIYRFHLVPISYRGRRHPEAALGVSEKGTAAAAAGGGTVMAAPL